MLNEINLKSEFLFTVAADANCLRLSEEEVEQER